MFRGPSGPGLGYQSQVQSRQKTGATSLFDLIADANAGKLQSSMKDGPSGQANKPKSDSDFDSARSQGLDVFFSQSAPRNQSARKVTEDEIKKKRWEEIQRKYRLQSPDNASKNTSQQSPVQGQTSRSFAGPTGAGQGQKLISAQGQNKFLNPGQGQNRFQERPQGQAGNPGIAQRGSQPMAQTPQGLGPRFPPPTSFERENTRGFQGNQRSEMERESFLQDYDSPTRSEINRSNTQLRGNMNDDYGDLSPTYIHRREYSPRKELPPSRDYPPIRDYSPGRDPYPSREFPRDFEFPRELPPRREFSPRRDLEQGRRYEENILEKRYSGDRGYSPDRSVRFPPERSIFDNQPVSREEFLGRKIQFPNIQRDYLPGDFDREIPATVPVRSTNIPTQHTPEQRGASMYPVPREQTAPRPTMVQPGPVPPPADLQLSRGNITQTAGSKEFQAARPGLQRGVAASFLSQESQPQISALGGQSAKSQTALLFEKIQRDLGIGVSQSSSVPAPTAGRGDSFSQSSYNQTSMAMSDSFALFPSSSSMATPQQQQQQATTATSNERSKSLDSNTVVEFQSNFSLLMKRLTESGLVRGLDSSNPQLAQSSSSGSGNMATASFRSTQGQGQNENQVFHSTDDYYKGFPSGKDKNADDQWEEFFVGKDCFREEQPTKAMRTARGTGSSSQFDKYTKSSGAVPPESSKQSHFCSICSVMCKGKTSYNAHIQHESHVMNVMLLAKQELEQEKAKQTDRDNDSDGEERRRSYNFPPPQSPDKCGHNMVDQGRFVVPHSVSPSDSLIDRRRRDRASSPSPSPARGRERRGERNRNSVRSPPRARGRSQDTDKTRSPVRVIGRNQDKVRGRSPVREKGQSQDRNRGRSPVQEKGRSQDRNRGRSPVREKGRSQDRNRCQSSEKRKMNSKDSEKSLEKTSEFKEKEAIIKANVYRIIPEEERIISLYDIIKKNNEIPMIGLEYINEIRSSEKNMNSNYICQLCGCGITLATAKACFTHMKGSPHRLRYLESHHPNVFEKMKTFTVRQEQNVAIEIECMAIEQRLGRESISTVQIKKPSDMDLSRIKLSDTVKLPAPQPDNFDATAKEKQPEKLTVPGTKFVSNDANYPLLGLEYVTEIRHPTDHELVRYRCKLCQQFYFVRDLFVMHVLSRRHRLAYFKETNKAVYEEYQGKYGQKVKNQFIDQKTKEYGVGFTPANVTVFMDKNGEAWIENDKLNEKKIKIVKKPTVLTFDLQKKKHGAEVVVKVETALKQVEPDVKKKEEFNWTEENSKLQYRIMNQNITRTQKASKFVTMFSQYLKSNPAVGLKWVTEFQRPDPTILPWFMCFLCKLKLEWNDILSHVTSLQHRENYMEKCFPSLHQLYTAMTFRSTVAKERKVLQYSRDIIGKEGLQSMEVMLELSVGLEELRATMTKTTKTSTATSAITTTSINAAANTFLATSGSQSTWIAESTQSRPGTSWAQTTTVPPGTEPAQATVHQPYPGYPSVPTLGGPEGAAPRLPSPQTPFSTNPNFIPQTTQMPAQYPPGLQYQQWPPPSIAAPPPFFGQPTSIYPQSGLQGPPPIMPINVADKDVQQMQYMHDQGQSVTNPPNIHLPPPGVGQWLTGPPPQQQPVTGIAVSTGSQVRAFPRPVSPSEFTPFRNLGRSRSRSRPRSLSPRRYRRSYSRSISPRGGRFSRSRSPRSPRRLRRSLSRSISPRRFRRSFSRSTTPVRFPRKRSRSNSPNWLRSGPYGQRFRRSPITAGNLGRLGRLSRSPVTGRRPFRRSLSPRNRQRSSSPIRRVVRKRSSSPKVSSKKAGLEKEAKGGPSGNRKVVVLEKKGKDKSAVKPTNDEKGNKGKDKSAVKSTNDEKGNKGKDKSAVKPTNDEKGNMGKDKSAVKSTNDEKGNKAKDKEEKKSGWGKKRTISSIESPEKDKGGKQTKKDGPANKKAKTSVAKQRGKTWGKSNTTSPSKKSKGSVKVPHKVGESHSVSVSVSIGKDSAVEKTDLSSSSEQAQPIQPISPIVSTFSPVSQSNTAPAPLSVSNQIGVIISSAALTAEKRENAQRKVQESRTFNASNIHVLCGKGRTGADVKPVQGENIKENTSAQSKAGSKVTEQGKTNKSPKAVGKHIETKQAPQTGLNEKTNVEITLTVIDTSQDTDNSGSTYVVSSTSKPELSQEKTPKSVGNKTNTGTRELKKQTVTQQIKPGEKKTIASTKPETVQRKPDTRQQQKSISSEELQKNIGTPRDRKKKTSTTPTVQQKQDFSKQEASTSSTPKVEQKKTDTGIEDKKLSSTVQGKPDASLKDQKKSSSSKAIQNITVSSKEETPSTHKTVQKTAGASKKEETKAKTPAVVQKKTPKPEQKITATHKAAAQKKTCESKQEQKSSTPRLEQMKVELHKPDGNKTNTPKAVQIKTDILKGDTMKSEQLSEVSGSMPKGPVSGGLKKTPTRKGETLTTAINTNVNTMKEQGEKKLVTVLMKEEVEQTDTVAEGKDEVVEEMDFSDNGSGMSMYFDSDDDGFPSEFITLDEVEMDDDHGDTMTTEVEHSKQDEKLSTKAVSEDLKSKSLQDGVGQAVSGPGKEEITAGDVAATDKVELKETDAAQKKPTPKVTSDSLPKEKPPVKKTQGRRKISETDTDLSSSTAQSSNETKGKETAKTPADTGHRRSLRNRPAEENSSLHQEIGSSVVTSVKTVEVSGSSSRKSTVKPLGSDVKTEKSSVDESLELVEQEIVNVSETAGTITPPQGNIEEVSITKAETEVKTAESSPISMSVAQKETSEVGSEGTVVPPPAAGDAMVPKDSGGSDMATNDTDSKMFPPQQSAWSEKVIKPQQSVLDENQPMVPVTANTGKETEEDGILAAPKKKAVTKKAAVKKKSVQKGRVTRNAASAVSRERENKTQTKTNEEELAVALPSEEITLTSPGLAETPISQSGSGSVSETSSNKEKSTDESKQTKQPSEDIVSVNKGVNGKASTGGSIGSVTPVKSMSDTDKADAIKADETKSVSSVLTVSNQSLTPPEVSVAKAEIGSKTDTKKVSQSVKKGQIESSKVNKIDVYATQPQSDTQQIVTDTQKIVTDTQKNVTDTPKNVTDTQKKVPAAVSDQSQNQQKAKVVKKTATQGGPSTVKKVIKKPVPGATGTKVVQKPPTVTGGQAGISEKSKDTLTTAQPHGVKLTKGDTKTVPAKSGITNTTSAEKKTSEAKTVISNKVSQKQPAASGSSSTRGKQVTTEMKDASAKGLDKQTKNVGGPKPQQTTSVKTKTGVVVKRKLTSNTSSGGSAGSKKPRIETKTDSIDVKREKHVQRPRGPSRWSAVHAGGGNDNLHQGPFEDWSPERRDDGLSSLDRYEAELDRERRGGRGYRVEHVYEDAQYQAVSPKEEERRHYERSEHFDREQFTISSDQRSRHSRVSREPTPHSQGYDNIEREENRSHHSYHSSRRERMSEVRDWEEEEELRQSGPRSTSRQDSDRWSPVRDDHSCDAVDYLLSIANDLKEDHHRQFERVSDDNNSLYGEGMDIEEDRFRDQRFDDRDLEVRNVDDRDFVDRDFVDRDLDIPGTSRVSHSRNISSYESRTEHRHEGSSQRGVTPERMPSEGSFGERSGRGNFDISFRGDRGRGDFDRPFRENRGRGQYSDRGGRESSSRGQTDSSFRGRGHFDNSFRGRGGNNNLSRGRRNPDRSFRGRGSFKSGNRSSRGRGSSGIPVRGRNASRGGFRERQSSSHTEESWNQQSQRDTGNRRVSRNTLDTSDRGRGAEFPPSCEITISFDN